MGANCNPKDLGCQGIQAMPLGLAFKGCCSGTKVKLP